MDRNDLQVAVAVEIFRTFPRSIVTELQNDPAFRKGIDSIIQTNITFGDNLTFSRKSLFDAIRAVFEDGRERTVVSEDGTSCRLNVEAVEGIRHPVLIIEHNRVTLPDFWYLSPVDSDRRIGIERDLAGVDPADPELRTWHDRVSAGPLDEIEAGLFDAELRLVPARVAELIYSGIESGSAPTAHLVPGVIRYYERLAGKLHQETAVAEYLENGAAAHAERLITRDALEGAKAALLLAAHPRYCRALQDIRIGRDDIGALFRWLAERADRISQVGGFEWGMTLLGEYPEIEDKLFSIARQIYDDDPESPDGRLRELSMLIVFVEGRVARAGFMRSKPPFWRRMATIAQASLIERQLVAVGLDANAAAHWPSQGGQYFYVQTLVDMRREPRWLPDFLEPKQLKAEFVGRIFAAARDHAAAIKLPEMREFLLAESGDNLRSQLSFPFAFMPGPLEGAVEAQTIPPDEIVETVRTQLSQASTDPNAFTALVNSCLVFKIAPEMATIAAEAIRNAKYLIRARGEEDQAFALLAGLAIVAAVTRSKELSQEIRILARVVRRRAKALISMEAHFRIGMFAAAAHADAVEWRKYVGDWITELAFEEMDIEDARIMKSHLQILLKIDPSLWQTCARAEAALRSLRADLA